MSVGQFIGCVGLLVIVAFFVWATMNNVRKARPEGWVNRGWFQ